MSEVGNICEKMDETSLAAAAEQTNTEKPVDVEPHQEDETNLEEVKQKDEVEAHKQHDEVLAATKEANIEMDAAPVVVVAEENLGTLECEGDKIENLEDTENITVSEDLESEQKPLENIPETNENKDLTEVIDNLADIEAAQEIFKDLSEESLETFSENQKKESEISALDSNVVENVLEIENVETSLESAQDVAQESLKTSSVVETECIESLTAVNDLSTEVAETEKSLEMASDQLNNEYKSTDKSAEISLESSKVDLNNEPAITQTPTTECNEEISPIIIIDLNNEPAITQTPTTECNEESSPIITESENKKPEPNKEPEIVPMETLDVNDKETINIVKEIEDIAEKEADSKNEEILPIEEQKELGESLEPMDIYDSQESINLVIDETSNTTDNKDDNGDASKINDDTNMEVDHEEVLTEMKENLPSNDKLQEETSIEKGKEEKETDTKENLPSSETETKNDNDSVKEPSTESVTEKEIMESSITPKDNETLDTPKESSTMETNILNKSKDDDCITVEQPPVPIIEIDDEDDIEDTTPITNNDAKKDITTKETESKMETDATKDALNSTDIEMTDKTQESLQKDSHEEDKDSLLAVAYEIPLEDALKLDESLQCKEDIEDTSDEVFYNKECINYECQHKHKQYFKVLQFAFSYFKVAKKKFKVQYICSDCYDKALEMYEEFCGLMQAKQPLLMENIPTGRQEFVEIIDSSDDEDLAKKTKPTETFKSAFSKNDLNLIENELHNTIKSVLERVEIQNQLTWSKTILAERLKRLEAETEYVDSELKSLQKKADKMHEGLYSCPKIKIRQLQPLDLNSGKVMAYDTQTPKEVQPIPPVGEIERPVIKLNSMYYAVKNNAIASWVPCRVMEQVEGGLAAQKNVKYYKIKFLKNQVQMPKTVPAKYLAYYDPPAVRLPIGTRVIAYFDATSLARGREKINVQSAFYPGIIAEPLKPNNKFRYLIFYDDGYTQYVYHKDVRLVCHVSESVWEDVHPASRDFIQKYLTQYSINRPMVQTQKGQSMNTESNGYWLHARVVDIDCSLVLMQFEGSKSHTEWIYRGSLRLGPVFKEYQKTLQKNSPMPISRLPRRTEPFIRYTEDEESSSQQQTEKTNDTTRAVARKTFGRPDSMMNSAQPTTQQAAQINTPMVKHLNNSTIYVEDENKPKGKVVYYTAKRNLPPRKYKQHKCSPACLFEITHNLSAYSPLSKPLLSGWERFIIRQKIKKVVTYRAPCGKIMRHMRELHHYLRVTQNVLNVDNFDFSHETNCLAEYVIESAIVQKRDISNGQEKMAIPLVNYYDNTLPPECKYSAKVIPTEGVHINTDPAFCVGCDCDDDCADKTKCACWQLTLTGAKYGNPNAAPEEVGYQYRRLLDHVPTGIYECNSNCKCKSSCLNRVVQNSLTMKLQVFKTSNRGWGLRCINDIPRGSFVCVYAGHLLTEAKANEGGQDAGDEYFAELDYIEVAEQIKEGYESEVELPEAEDEEPYNPEGEGDDEFTPSRSFLTRSKQKLNAAKSTRNTEEDSQERQVINFNPNADMNEDSVRENSIRKLYGNDEACYVMDAKISGNLGRYFNHSCAPNMFVQNVFVDTHDLRFPHVAFFSSSNIRAGSELTWNYNYEVGVVPGKVLYCQCGASTCRLRLL